MTETMPPVNDDDRVSIKNACAKLAICRDSLRKYMRKIGVMEPHIWACSGQKFYYGHEIKSVWQMEFDGNVNSRTGRLLESDPTREVQQITTRNNGKSN